MSEHVSDELRREIAALRAQLSTMKDAVGEENWSIRQQLAASEARCKIYEEAFNELQNEILYAQHLLKGD